ncbi:MAG: Undecaprenyl-phosphate 4-deoxy-4-formamido-L-arabinose transferase [Syntrophorhabdaceae bacterium PtaU1.Bin034]|nr:MAG: Undecaprenyl-phosphate 4-deoxy-4-formamido-L-arabinose transferase [Syntrophorhabdaceae bacterium PtaU1.Bin034]
MGDKVDISVLVPVLNEEESLEELNERLTKTLQSMGKTYEIIYINDGSTDRTQQMIEGYREKDRRVKIIEFNRNYGQHMALFAGFERAQGNIMVTIDADLQNPPEEIPRLVEKAEQGYDVVATYRKGRQDSIFRRWPSWVVNKITSRLVGAKLRDYGCMLRAYSRNVIDSINLCQESSSFIPALANTYAKRIVEIEVGHEERKRGVSKYGLFRLLRLNFDLMTGFSLLPIQFIGIFGVIIAVVGLGFAVFLLARRFIIGPESEGLFTLFAILFFFLGIQIFALGIIGEYIGRIFQEVRRRPRFIVKREFL